MTEQKRRTSELSIESSRVSSDSVHTQLKQESFILETTGQYRTVLTGSFYEIELCHIHTDVSTDTCTGLILFYLSVSK